MSTAWTRTEIYTKVRTLTTEIEALRQSGPLKYKIGTKTVDRTAELRLLLDEREFWQKQLASASDGTKEVTKILDYEMDRYGIQHGQEIDGDDC